MSFREVVRADRFDRFIERTLKMSLGAARPAAEIRRSLLVLASRPEEEEAVISVPSYLMERALPGGYRDIQHRLAGRSLVYISPFGTTVLGLLS
ncbi:MAG: hypothetical protein WBR18_03335 [Anaerolineales bacterium]